MHRFASWPILVWRCQFLGSREPRAHISCSLVRFLLTHLSHFPLYSCLSIPSITQRAHILSAKSARCQRYESDHKFLSLFFLPYWCSIFCLSSLVKASYPMASNASSPKALHTLAFFISISLIVLPDCAHSKTSLHTIIKT